MRVVSWNMNFWQQRSTHAEAWAYLMKDLRPDLALLQESVPPAELAEQRKCVWQAIGDKRDWGSTICAPALAIWPIGFRTHYGGSVTAAEITLSSGRLLIAVSLYARLEDGYSITALHRIFSDLTPLLDSTKHPVVLGGDFNASVKWDAKQNQRSHRILFDRVEDFGLRSAIPIAEQPSTYKDWGMLDYIFVSKGLDVDCSVGVAGRAEGLSDHKPLIAELDLS